ncbi:MFS transporter [Nonomuraea sp. NPDC049646]|uniref:MFS transporter n=1 Tax=unclassified Nonomuraea TaxID=2593643 RepID=UPI0037BA6621
MTLPDDTAQGERSQGSAPLTRNLPFLGYLAARAQSQIGSSITATAIPLIAATWLGASAAQMGLLVAVPFVSRVAGRLVAAVLVERSRSRVTALAAIEVTSGLCVVAVTLLAVSHDLSIPGLIALVSIIAGLTGAFGSFSAPVVLDLVDPGRLTKANGAMAGAAHLSTIAGPGIFGLLLQFLAMPMVLVVDAISYFASALLILPLRRRALPRAQARVPDRGLRGFRHAFRGDIRIYMAGAALICLINGAVIALLPLYATHDLGLSADAYAVILVTGAAGGLIGSATASFWETRLGRNRAAFVAGAVATGATGFLVFVDKGLSGALGCGAYELVGSAGGSVFVVLMMSSIPASVPSDAVARSMAVGALVLELGTAIGAAAGGVMGTAAGIRPTVELCLSVAATALLAVALRGGLSAMRSRS